MAELLNHLNEYSEPVASRYRRVRWAPLDCRRALEEAKFQRDKDEWFCPGVEQGLSLSALMQNLRTFAIREPGTDALLIPLSTASSSTWWGSCTGIRRRSLRRMPCGRGWWDRTRSWTRPRRPT